MTSIDRWLVRVAAVVVLLWFGWQLAATTVVRLLQANAEITQLRQHVQQLEAAAPKPPAAPQKPAK